MSIMAAGLFETPKEAVDAVENLRAAGFTDSELSLISDRASTHDDKDHRSVVGAVLDAAPDEKPGVGTAMGVGAASGAAVVALAAAGVVALPIAAPLGVIGWLATTAVTSVWAGTMGGLIARFLEEGVPEELGQRYAELVEQGKSLVIVRVSNDQAERAAQAKDIMRAHGMMEV